MKYRVEISSVAEAEADGAFLRISQITLPPKRKPVVCRVAQSNRIFIDNAKALSHSTRE